MNKINKKKLALGTEILRPLRLETASQVAGGFKSWGTCVSEDIKCPVTSPCP